MMKFILPVMAALVSTFLTGLILFPLVKIVFDHFFHLYLFTTPPVDSWKDDLIVEIAVVLWFFISSSAGGFVSSLLSEKKEDFSILIFLISTFLIALLFTNGAIIREFDEFILFLFVSFIGGTCLGNLSGLRYKKKKERLKDNMPSHPDNS